VHYRNKSKFYSIFLFSLNFKIAASGYNGTVIKYSQFAPAEIGQFDLVDSRSGYKLFYLSNINTEI
jgi:hypothetical protein